MFAQIAQSVEQRTENPRVTGSIPVLGMINLMNIAFVVFIRFFYFILTFFGCHSLYRIEGTVKNKFFTGQICARAQIAVCVEREVCMLEKIIKKYYDEIFHYCYHNVCNRAAAEDLCQDTFVSFIGHYAEVRNMGKAKNYLYTIAKNKCKDYYKKKTPIFMEDVPEQEGDARMEELVIVRQMVMSLPEAFREAVVLRYFQNLKYPEIAAILGISLSLAKYRVKQGLELLSEMEVGRERKSD